MNGLLLCLLLVCQTPDARGEARVDEPRWKGETATAPIPAELHIRNEGGSDGAGLCVISSLLCNGRFQRVPLLLDGKESGFWRAAKAAPGGYWPEKLKALIDKTMKGEVYQSYYGMNADVLDEWSRKGYAIGVTMNTSSFYDYQPIHHMVSLVHYRKGGWAMVVDNNDPGYFYVMPAAEFDRRWVDGDAGWAVIWERLPEGLRVAVPSLLWLAVGLIARRVIRLGASALRTE